MANALNTLMQGLASAPAQEKNKTPASQELFPDTDSTDDAAARDSDSARQKDKNSNEFSELLRSQSSRSDELLDDDDALVAKDSPATDVENGDEPDEEGSIDPQLFFNAPGPLVGSQNDRALSELPLASDGNSLPQAGQELPATATLAGLPRPVVDEQQYSQLEPATDISSIASDLDTVSAEAEDPIFDGLSFLPESGSVAAALTEKNLTKTALLNGQGFDELELAHRAGTDTLDALSIKQRAALRYNAGLQGEPLDGEGLPRSAAAGLQPLRLDQRLLDSGQLNDRQEFKIGMDRMALLDGAALSATPTASALTASTEQGSVVSENLPPNITSGQSFAARIDLAMKDALDISVSRNEQSRVTVPFNQPGWSENLGKQLGMLVSRNMDAAQIQLDPPELGPMQVRIHVQHDQVTLQFTSNHATVRDALEQSVARLQQMFSEEGMDLVNVNVSDQESSGEHQRQESDESANSIAIVESDEILTQRLRMPISDGKIDYFI